MVTPAQRAKKYGELSYEEYALWYASEIGVTEGDIAAAGKMRSVELIEDAVTALLPTVDEQDVAEEPTEEVYEATSELATPEEIGDSEDFPTDLTYDAMTVKELQALCNLLMRRHDEQKHEISVDPDNPDIIMEVWVRDVSFFDIQKAAQEMFNIGKDGQMSLNLEGFYKYAFSNWVVRTNPAMSNDDLLKLKGHIGEQISALLPSPNELGEMMAGGFTKGGKK